MIVDPIKVDQAKNQRLLNHFKWVYGYLMALSHLQWFLFIPIQTFFFLHHNSDNNLSSSKLRWMPIFFEIATISYLHQSCKNMRMLVKMTAICWTTGWMSKVWQIVVKISTTNKLGRKCDHHQGTQKKIQILIIT